MTPNSTRFCPNCNTPLESNQRFCSNCGTVVELSANKPTEFTPNSAGALQDVPTYMDTSLPPPPPPPQSYPPSQMDYQAPAYPQSSQMNYQAPAYTQPPKDASKRVLGQIGCGVMAIILVVLALCGTAGFFVYRFVSSPASSTQSNTSTTNSTSGNGSNDSNAITPTAAPATTSPVNATIKYADVDMTIIDVKQAASFSDENNATSSTTNIVRIDINEANKTTRSSGYYFGDVVRLLLPDSTSVVPLNSQYITGPDASVVRKNWIDFALAPTTDVSKLTLHLGKSSEAQIDVPLTNNPDVAKYQPKTVSPGKSTQYAGPTWTIVSATKQLSGDNAQAPQGQVYVIVKLKVDNNSTTDFNAYWGDYLRLKSGSATATATTNSTIPITVNAGQTNQSGECAFLLPQGSTDFSLLFLANSAGNVQATSISFQIA